MPEHLTCPLRNLYADQEATVRIRHGTTDWFLTAKGLYQGCILSPCLFNLFAEYIMRNAGLEEAKAGIKIAGRNISNLSDVQFLCTICWQGYPSSIELLLQHYYYYYYYFKEHWVEHICVDVLLDIPLFSVDL